jgi:hypothetical protein
LDEAENIAAGAPSLTSCSTDLAIACLVEGTLPAPLASCLLAHLADCDDCREVVATVVAAGQGPPPTPDDLADPTK